MPDRVVVVGGGVIGSMSRTTSRRPAFASRCSTAGDSAPACSHANCGYVCPSHVLPLAMPGAVWSTLKTLFQRNSPLKVRPGVVLRNLGWFLGFARRCNRRDMIEPGRAIQALLNSSRSLSTTLIREENLACEWETKGLLFVFQTPKAFDHYATRTTCSARVRMPAKRFDSSRTLTALEPRLKPGGGRRLPLRIRCPPAARSADGRIAAHASTGLGVEDPREL